MTFDWDSVQVQAALIQSVGIIWGAFILGVWLRK